MFRFILLGHGKNIDFLTFCVFYIRQRFTEVFLDEDFTFSGPQDL